MCRRDTLAPLQIFRTLLLGRSWNDQNRLPYMLSPKPYPKPNLITGPAHKAFDNYYVYRDPRRAVNPPEQLSQIKMITDSSDKTIKLNKNLPPAPGNIYHWD